MKTIALLALASLVLGCATTDQGPDPDEVAAADAWAEASGGKADLPDSYADLVAWIRDFYRNRLSAVWANQEHPASAAAAVARIRQLVGTDPSQLRFPTTVRRLRFSDVADHSEIDIALPGGRVVRLIGDPKGSGAYVDTQPFATALSPALCLTWDELVTAIDAAYVPGAYGVDFVCHNVTERVLRALGVGSHVFSSQIHAYSIARYIWGPQWPSFNSQDPSSWPESRSCR